ncbi:hypothetical protein [Clostridium uliginosum]|uniref:hypothetical protein n=1 Tax=Clostridium uliginosum TaxID=119641 RepID=UPI00158811AF|nr:hypothetical protein [Clostridium uliginosum]
MNGKKSKWMISFIKSVLEKIKLISVNEDLLYGKLTYILNNQCNSIIESLNKVKD